MQTNSPGPNQRNHADKGSGIFGKCGQFKRADQLRDAGLYPYFHASSSAQSCRGQVFDFEFLRSKGKGVSESNKF